MCHRLGQCNVPLLVHLLTKCKLLQKIGENRNARLLPLSVGSIAQLHDCDREYSRLSICVPPTSVPPPPPPTPLHCQTPQSRPISLGSLPPSHTPPPSSTELWGRCHWAFPPTTASFVSSSSPHPSISPCTPRCSAPGPQGRPAGCSPFPHSAQFWTFWTLPPFQLCSLGGLGATIVRRGSVRQGVTSHQRTTRGTLTTSSQKPKKTLALFQVCLDHLPNLLPLCISLPCPCLSHSWNSQQLAVAGKDKLGCLQCGESPPPRCGQHTSGQRHSHWSPITSGFLLGNHLDHTGQLVKYQLFCDCLAST